MADWLELRALVADDRSASAADLRRGIVAMGLARESDPDDGRSGDELLAAAAFVELLDRERASPDCYPFEISGGQVRLRDREEEYWAYIFCLLVSFSGMDRAEAPVRVAELFEEVCTIAAGRYVSGRTLKFGFPRRVLPAGFMAAVSAICTDLGEGEGARARPKSAAAKDARLDIVAWRPFPDRRRAQLILFGQCAAGGNWDQKLTDLQPRDFTDLYWLDAPVVDPVKSFFTPFRVSKDTWYVTAKYAGILFDRCRIASTIHRERPPQNVLDWLRTELARVRGALPRQRQARAQGAQRRGRKRDVGKRAR